MPQFRDKRSRTTSGGSDGWPNCVNSRAEKSRHAAKMRRDKESEEILALSKILPYPDDVTSRLDKGSVIRLATSFLRMKNYSQREGDALLDELQSNSPNSEETSKELVTEVTDGSLMLQAWNGFLVFISRKGQIYYISENASKHLGIHQFEMLGKSMLDFIHPDDHKELAKQFMVSVPGQQTFKGYGMEGTKDRPTAMSVNFFNQTDEEYVSISDFIQERSFFLRMRSVMSKKSSSGKGKVVGYRVVNFSGRLKLKSSPNNSGFTVEGLICLCRPIQPLPVVEIRMDGNMFMSRHGMDMSFTFCDPRIITLIGYEPHELIGKTVYQFHNPLDASKVSDCHSNLIVKGSSMSKYYRFLGKVGEWVWMRTKATIIYNTSGVAQYVVAMNYVIGKEEGERMLMLERMQGAIESPVASSSSPSCSDGEACQSPISSPSRGSPVSDNEGPQQPLKAEEVAHFIPAAVCEPILKPPMEVVDFSSLVSNGTPSSSAPPPPEGMDISETVSSHSPPPADAQLDMHPAAKVSVTLKPSLPHMFQTELSKSDSPQSDLESVSSGSTGCDSSPPVITSFDQRRDKESHLEDFFDYPKCTTDQSTGSTLLASSPMFSNGSPASGSSLVDSPGSPYIGNNFLEELVESEVFRDEQTSVQAKSGILQDLLKKEPLTHQYMSVNITDLTLLDTEQSLPQDIADFSLEFYNKLIDQSAQDAASVMGNDLELVEASEMKITEPCGPVTPNSFAVITELPPDRASVVIPSPSTDSVGDGGGGILPSSGRSENILSFSDSVVDANDFSTNVPDLPNVPPMPQNVTDGLSKLEIKDSKHAGGDISSQSTKSLLKALLMGRGGNHLAAQSPAAKRGSSQSGGVHPNERYYPSAGVNIHPHTEGGPAGVATNGMANDAASHIPFNNNIPGQDDYAIYERQRQKLLFLEQKHRQQQEFLLQNHLHEQQLLQQRQQQQLMLEMRQSIMHLPSPQSVMDGIQTATPPGMMNVPQANYGAQEFGALGSPQQAMSTAPSNRSLPMRNGFVSAVNYSSNNSQMNEESFHNVQVNGGQTSLSPNNPPSVVPAPPPTMQPIIHTNAHISMVTDNMVPQFQTYEMSVEGTPTLKCTATMNSNIDMWGSGSAGSQSQLTEQFMDTGHLEEQFSTQLTQQF